MKAITFKGLVLRMILAFIAAVTIMSMQPAHATVTEQLDQSAQMHRAAMPAAPTKEQYRAAEARLNQLRISRADAIGNVRPMANFDDKVQSGSLGQGEVFLPENK